MWVEKGEMTDEASNENDRLVKTAWVEERGWGET